MLLVLVAMLVVLVVTLVLVALSWLPFTASVLVSLKVPAATLMILLPPLLRPALVKVISVIPTGLVAALVIVMPVLLSLLAPVVTLPVAPRSRVLFKLTCTPSAVVVLVRLSSPFTLMVSPKANWLLVVPLPTLMPRLALPNALFAVVFAVLAVVFAVLAVVFAVLAVF